MRSTYLFNNIEETATKKTQKALNSTQEIMTRGNQRDLAVAKGLKKKLEEGKGQRGDGKTRAQAKEDDAAIMRAKNEKALAAKAAKEAEGK